MFHKILIGLLLLSTVTTTVVAVNKVINQDQAEDEAQVGFVDLTAEFPTGLPNAIDTVTPGYLTPTLGAFPTVKLFTPTPIRSLASSGKCIVALYGKQYDITGLVNTHTGGNIFKCGTDMTTSYQNKHGSSLTRMSKYLLTSGIVIIATSTPTKAHSSGSCLVTISGQQYDITNLVNTHSGGNVFNCGTDMTSKYQSQHGTGLSRMSQYLIASAGNNGGAPTSTSVPTRVPTTGKCIVTLSGQQYDITNLLNTHSGGNIFKCGTDMTSTYQTRHGTSLSRMSQYLIASAGGNTPVPTIVPTSPPNNNLCLVTLFGKQYDITRLVSTHSGGNIFSCGTDMSSTYQSKHGTGVSRMSQYLYNGGGSTITGVPTSKPSPPEDDD